MNIKSPVAYIIILLAILVAACSAPVTPETTADSTSAAPATTEAPVSPPPVDAPPTEASIAHTDIPINLPQTSNGAAADFDSSKVLASSSLVGGDRFTFGRFERPFNANAMDTYFPEIDIINTEFFQDDTWIYGLLSIKDLSASSSRPAQYAIEIDTTLNGKANWLILSAKPSSTNWSTDGVQIYKDANEDIGGISPSMTDESLPGGDGFETMIFDQGIGDDPDAAWIRFSPNDSNIIEFAIKRSALENPTQYMINMWAGYSLDPGMFDINDRYTHEEAGAADAGLEYFYPIKAVAEVDNSCRVPVGFQPTGKEPGLCATPQQIAVGDNPASQSGAAGRACPIGLVQKCDPLEGCWCEPVFSLPTPPPIIIIP